MMRVAHVISAPAAGGAEIYVKDLAKSLASRGVEVYILFLNRAKDVGRSIEFERKFIEELQVAGIEYSFIGHEVRRNPILGAMRVRKFVKKNSIDLYHSHLTHGILGGAFLNIPRAYTHHNFDMRVPKLAHVGLDFILERYIGISDICSKKLSEYAGKPIVTIKNGVPPESLNHRYKKQLPSDKINCLAIGRISAQKNYSLLIDAVSLLSEETRRRLKISIAGEGEKKLETKLLEKINKANLSNTISFIGNRSDIPELLGKTDLFLMSSAWEGLPIALIEATLCGIPCVVTNVGGCSEVVQSCQSGLMVEPGNAENFSKALEEIVSDSLRYEEYSRNALLNSKEFTIDEACKSHIIAYEDLLKSHA